MPSPPYLQNASFWIDESGSRGSAGSKYVLAGIKTRHPDELQRKIATVRDRYDSRTESEFKFARVRDHKVPLFCEAIDVLGDSDARLIVTICDLNWKGSKSNAWLRLAGVSSLLVRAGLNRNETAAVFIDGITTPPDVALGAQVKRQVNSALRTQAVTVAVSLDSKSNDLLQLADLVAGSVRHMRYEPRTDSRAGSAKRRVARRLLEAFDLDDFSDQKSKRVSILTLRE